MRVLLDTQVWLWMLMSPDRLSEHAKELVSTAQNELLLSAASTWELAIKVGLGRLSLSGPPHLVVPDMMAATLVTPLPVLHSHTLRVATLPDHHRDPFDRLLVAQSQLESVPIITADPMLQRYDVEVLAA